MQNNIIRIDFDHLPARINMNSPSWRGRKTRRTVGVKNVVRDVLKGRTDLPDKPLEQVELSIVFHLANAASDLENRRSSLKPYIDGLVSLGIIRQDNAKVIRKETLEWDECSPEVGPGFTIYIRPLTV